MHKEVDSNFNGCLIHKSFCMLDAIQKEENSDDWYKVPVLLPVQKLWEESEVA